MSDLPEIDRHRLLVEWNATEVMDRRDVCVHRFFEERAHETPEAIAVEDARERVTYRELDARANRLANYLKGRGVGPDVRVAVCLERAPEAIVAVLAILKAGGAYVPIDAM